MNTLQAYTLVYGFYCNLELFVLLQGKEILIYEGQFASASLFYFP